MKRKLLRFVTFAFTALSLALSGCAKDGQAVNLDAASVETGTGDIVSGMEPVPMETGEKIIFPERYIETIGNVAFNMDIIVNAELTSDSVVTAKAQMQKVNQERALLLFYNTIDEYDIYDYEEEDEYGQSVHSVTYVSPEETILSYGPRSSQFHYMESDLVPYVLNAFVPYEDRRQNADLYGTEVQLSFMTREKAFEEIQDVLKEIGIEIEAVYVGYALDHETMQSQEYHENIDGDIDRSQYKVQWSDADDCYCFYINQTYRGLPLYHVYNEIFTEAADVNAPIQAVVSGEGIEMLNIEKVFMFTDEKEGVSLADLETVIQTVADKYNQIPDDSTYEITKAELYYYVDLSSGMGIYDVKPVWIFTGDEKGGENIQMMIDAQTAEEIVL